jgi:hypothetical protein
MAIIESGGVTYDVDVSRAQVQSAFQQLLGGVNHVAFPSESSTVVVFSTGVVLRVR